MRFRGECKRVQSQWYVHMYKMFLLLLGKGRELLGKTLGDEELLELARLVHCSVSWCLRLHGIRPTHSRS